MSCRTASRYIHILGQFPETRESSHLLNLEVQYRSPPRTSVPVTRDKELSFVDKMTKSFLYFAYGSNLLAQRIHISNPSAVRKETGKLEDYRLDFGGPYSNTWGGCPATVVPHRGKHVWGAVWEIDNSDILYLDRQEGVHANIYFPIEVCVETPSGGKINCRSYQLCATPKALRDGEILPRERQPSQIYLEVIIKGAIESALPSTYIEELKCIPDNGNKGTLETPISFPCKFS